MINTTAFDHLVGQHSVKKRLGVYLGAYKNTGNIPFLNFIGGAGCGKTVFCKTFRHNLTRENAKRPPLIEVNASTIKNAVEFFEQVYPNWVQNSGFLFLDEAHGLPQDLQEIFLTVLNIERGFLRTVSVDGVPYNFNFNELSIAFGSTDQQKLSEALRDRLTDISLEEYKPTELLEVFELNLHDSIVLKDECKEELTNRFRGNPRDAVLKTDDLFYYCEARNNYTITLPFLLDFFNDMGIMRYGLNQGEVQVLKAIGERGECSLQTIKSATGLSRSAIQRDYEGYLLKRNLMSIHVKRRLTRKGRELYLELS